MDAINDAHLFAEQWAHIASILADLKPNKIARDKEIIGKPLRKQTSTYFGKRQNDIERCNKSAKIINSIDFVHNIAQHIRNDPVNQ